MNPTRQPLLPFTVRPTGVVAGDLVELDGDLRRVTEAQGLEESTRLLFGDFEDDLVLKDGDAVTVYRVPSDEEWWAFLATEHDVSRWPNG